jgi:hypothetical protein
MKSAEHWNFSNCRRNVERNCRCLRRFFEVIGPTVRKGSEDLTAGDSSDGAGRALSRIAKGKIANRRSRVTSDGAEGFTRGLVLGQMSHRMWRAADKLETEGSRLVVECRRRSTSRTELRLAPYPLCPPFHRMKRGKVCFWLEAGNIGCDLRKRVSPFPPRSPVHRRSSFSAYFAWSVVTAWATG